MKKILVLCTGNSCRSQIAEGYLRKYTGNKAEIFSAGIETHGVNSKAIEIMKEDGLDISGHNSNNINEYAGMNLDFIITVCDNAKENCPFFPSSAKQFHQNFSDPSKVTGTEVEINNAFSQVRFEIKEFRKKFVTANL